MLYLGNFKQWNTIQIHIGDNLIFFNNTKDFYFNHYIHN